MKYAAGCEDVPNYQEKVELRCDSGTKIVIVKADYGRDKYSSVCGDFFYEGNCTARTDTEELLKNLCGNKQNCDVVANPDVFPDSCPGVRKLLRIWYQCVGDGKNLIYKVIISH